MLTPLLDCSAACSRPSVPCIYGRNWIGPPGSYLGWFVADANDTHDSQLYGSYKHT